MQCCSVCIELNLTKHLSLFHRVQLHLSCIVEK